MAGSSGSGEDIESGRTNDSESTTVMHGGRPSELDVGFNGICVFEAGPRRDEQRPDSTLNGLLGRGWNGADSPGQREPGAGVIGVGAANHGPGMVGLGGGAVITAPILGSPGNLGQLGLGGTGVIGLGGPGDITSPALDDDIAVDTPRLPGAGVVGQGGTSFFLTPADGSGTPATGNGPGVVGIAGGLDRDAAPQANLSQADLAAMANVGVVGLGGDGPKSVGGSGTTLIGPLSAGAGVRGVGGVAGMPGTTVGAPGVVGVAGGVSVPADAAFTGIGVAGLGGGGAGVFGTSSASPGVSGTSASGIGVIGSSAKSNGGSFSSREVAQIHLEPLRTPMNTPSGVLPGRAGDLVVLRTEERTQFVTLWFCRMSGNAATATWQKIA